MPKQFGQIKLMLVLACLFLYLASSAQDYYEGPKAKTPVKATTTEPEPNEGGFNLSVSVGTAIPFKSFSSTNVKNSFWDFTSIDSVKLQGFAKLGVHFNLTASYMFPDGLGIQFMLGSNSNSFDINTFAKTVGVPFTSPDGLFRTREYLIGPFVSYSPWPKFTLEANAMLGIVTANYPIITVSFGDTTQTIEFNPGRSFGYSFGGALKYSINPKLDFSINSSYTQATIAYQGWTNTFTIPGYYPYIISHTTDIAKMPMGLLKINAGLTYKFR